MFYELAQLAVSNLKRARARLLMTAGGVVVGTTAVILLIALTIGLQQAAESGIGSSSALTQIDVYQRWSETGGSTPQLTDEAVSAFWQIPGVRIVMAVLRLQSSELRSGDYIGYGEVLGIDTRLLPYLGWQVQAGELALQPGQALAGMYVGQNFYDPSNEEGWTPVPIDLLNDPVKLRLTNWQTSATRDIDMKFTGILTETGSFNDYVIYMSMDEVRRWNEWLNGQAYDPEKFVYDQVIVYATSRETVQGVSEAIRDLGYGTGGIGDYLNSLNSFFVTMRIMLGAIGGVALLVAAFGVANTMMMAILERTREIGIMKAIGATNEAILTLFLLESGLVGLVGGASGVLLSKLLQNLVNNGLQNMPQGEGGVYFLPFDPSQIGSNLLVIPSELIVFALVLATGVGLAAGFYPAWRAANLPPVLALKQD
jgi:putative ABC transport system permease protein